MKGILKGLRNISQMFEPNCKEPEMQIGFPTDVKHVAHIGWDGPSTTAPTWMNEFKSTPDFSTASSNNSGEGKDSPTKPSSSQGGLQESKSRDVLELPKPSKRNQDSSNPSSKQGRRHKKSSSGAESPTKESSSCGAQKESRRKKMRDSSHGGSTRSSSRSKAQDASSSDQDMKSEDQFPELF
ncbi:CRIB domain-containing protein RIC7-like protein [Cinnamomum micranthum f. kanehirae]|uniref:CRIB domain-containing protein RIC7-like protein n=1 Tax=Cinnamomum micranthum f. kanehirae TaxID=337451 RepID=A0A443NRL3_9MAGN|nr:CRIB domain-containing protein RIC7-like protein [Cinnamomum micranthum f. kanehirae]